MSTNMVEITEVYISEGGRFYTQSLTLFIYFITYKTNFNTHFLISFIISDRLKKKDISEVCDFTVEYFADNFIKVFKEWPCFY